MNEDMNSKRSKHLEDNIRQDINLLKEFEDELRYETNPRRMEQLRRDIDRQRESLKRYQQEQAKIIVNQIKDIIENSGVLFIGEKVSEISGVPNFGKFIIDIIESITKCKFGATEYTILKNLRPESAFEILHDEIGDDIQICFEAFNNYKPKPIHYYIANEIKKGKCVFTTNRDNLIEEACKPCKPSDDNIEYELIFEDSEFGNVFKNLQSDQPPHVGHIFMLNGNFDKNEKGNKRFKPFLDSLKGVGKDLHTDKMGVLKYFLENFDFCFLGYNCSDDYSIYTVLKDTYKDRGMFWFNHAEKPIEIISTREPIEAEIKNEERKRLRDRDREILCLNNILLKRKIFKKITGNWIEIIQNELCSALDIPQSAYSPPVEKKESSIKLPKLGEIDDYTKYIIHGRLWEECLSRAIAKECFENAEMLGEGIDKAKAKLCLARVCDRLYGKSKENIVTKKYQESYEIYKTQESSFISEAAQCKIGLANFKRRVLKQFNKAREECEEAKEMLKSVKNKDEKYKLAYAQCLSCLGLIYSKLGGEYISQCDRLFNSSLDCRKEIGDIMGKAETENDMGLTKRNKRNKDINEISDAVYHLKNALDINESIGNYIGAAKNYRNLGLCYTDCINLVENKTAKEGYFDLAKKSYKSAIACWDIMKGDAPNEVIWEYHYRLGELEVNYGDITEGIMLLKEVKKNWDDIGDWHNRARSLDLLCKAYSSKEYIDPEGTKDVKSTIDEIMDTYENILGDDNKLKEMKEDKDKFNNAVQILERTKEIIIALEEPNRKADAVDKIIENLRKIMRKMLNKSSK
jgi:tetratricopeptide (TPR) repeat protein